METKVREGAHRRRAPLRETASDLELAISAPVGTGPVWRNRVRESLARVQVALKQHVQDTEGPEGLYGELQNDAPRLSNLVKLLTKEHIVLKEDINRALTALEGLPTEIDDECCEDVREAVLTVLGRISRHRQKGADLVWRAYSVDIGGE
ncbi:MAG: hypothetical protein OEM81_12775 [Acidimicrobiia bacterium]|nr:hypothetical protein [Acidimicrobiia bacterium]MDH3398687.1 hypothetical protein [Acidimicrobiia bacterium]